LNAQVLGVSVDHIPCLEAWAENLGGISYPLLSDFWPHGSVANLYGVLRSADGKSERAIFVIDAEGTIRYIDIHPIDDRPDNEEVRKALRAIEGPREAPAPAQPAAAPAEPAPEEIVLYCARWCKDCRKMRAWFEERGLPYTEVDIDVNMEARARVRRWGNGFLITPVVSVDGEPILDYHPEQVEAALRKRES
jgi:glutaredoxin